MIVITSRRQVAQVWGKPIYVITGVTLIPLSSFSEAKLAIENHRKALESGEGSHAGATADSDTSEDEVERADRATTTETEDDLPSPAKGRSAASGGSQDAPSVAQDVIGKRGAYGRFAERWFSKNGWSVERRKSLGMSPDSSDPGRPQRPLVDKLDSEQRSKADLNEHDEAIECPREASAPATIPAEASGIVATLIPKLLRTTRLLLNSQSFYFSYDHDITRRIGTGKGGDLPLHKRVDPQVSSYDFLEECTNSL